MSSYDIPHAEQGPRDGAPPSLVRDLLTYAAGRSLPGGALPGRVLRWDRVDEDQLRFVLLAGLGPMLHRALGAAGAVLPPAWRELLHASDLSARLRHGNLTDTAADAIDACAELGVPVTLLKGISTSDQYYPAAHERPMGDIDILVPADARTAVENALLRRGFVPSGIAVDEEDGCHGSPVYDPDRQVLVEVHSALFPRNDPVQRERPFDPASIAAGTIDSTFRGREVRRLTPELQLVYIASYWIRDLTQHRMHPSHLPPLLDAIYLLGATSLDWDRIVAGLDNPRAATSLHILLSYVVRSEFDGAAAAHLPRLAVHRHALDRSHLRLIHAMLDAGLIRGRQIAQPYGDWMGTVMLRTLDTLLGPGTHAAKLARVPWNIVFPQSEPDRYRLAFHWDRIVRIVRRSGPRPSRH